MFKQKFLFFVLKMAATEKGLVFCTGVFRDSEDFEVDEDGNAIPRQFYDKHYTTGRITGLEGEKIKNVQLHDNPKNTDDDGLHCEHIYFLTESGKLFVSYAFNTDGHKPLVIKNNTAYPHHSFIGTNVDEILHTSDAFYILVNKVVYYNNYYIDNWIPLDFPNNTPISIGLGVEKKEVEDFGKKGILVLDYPVVLTKVINEPNQYSINFIDIIKDKISSRSFFLEKDLTNAKLVNRGTINKDNVFIIVGNDVYNYAISEQKFLGDGDPAPCTIKKAKFIDSSDPLVIKCEDDEHIVVGGPSLPKMIRVDVLDICRYERHNFSRKSTDDLRKTEIISLCTIDSKPSFSIEFRDEKVTEGDAIKTDDGEMIMGRVNNCYLLGLSKNIIIWTS